MNASDLGAVLVVDDSPEFLDSVDWALRRLGAGSPRLHATSGDEALATLRSLPILPGLVLLDLNLPGLDGRQALREIRADPRLAPLVVAVLSTSDDPRDLAVTREVGADAYLVKPMRLDALLDKLGALFDALPDPSRLPFPL